MEPYPDFFDPFCAQIGKASAERFESVVDVQNVFGSLGTVPLRIHQGLLGQEAHGIRNQHLFPLCKGKAIRGGQDDRPGGNQ
jgi:hypothetical protein